MITKLIIVLHVEGDGPKAMYISCSASVLEKQYRKRKGTAIENREQQHTRIEDIQNIKPS
jgi:hypothetical protein